MRSRDSPWADRALNVGGDGASERSRRDVDGAAREPTELLEQLRQRLDRLAANHPSAARDRAGRRPNAEPADVEGGEPADYREPDGAAGEPAGETEPAERAVQPAAEGNERAGGQDDQELAGGAEHRDQAAASGSSRLNLGLPSGLAEGYRPWFMSPAEGVPWFAEEPGQAG